MTDETMKSFGDVILQLPVRLVRALADVHVVDVPEDPLMIAARPWAVLYRNTEGGPLHVAGFEEKEQLSELIAALYRTGEIVAVLHNGRPRKFDMRVKALIG